MTTKFQTSALKDKDYESIAARLRKGEVLLYPTETTYGLGCVASERAGIERIFELKQRPAERPFLVLVRDRKMLTEYVSEIPAPYEPLMERFWPGPLTLVFPARENMLPLDLLAPGLSTLAIRISSDPFCTRLLEALGTPLVSTSANLSGAPNPTSLEDVSHFVKNGVDMLVDGGTLSGRPSTVVRLDGGKAAIVREGALSAKDLGID